jgi:hypothetical protein
MIIPETPRFYNHSIMIVTFETLENKGTTDTPPFLGSDMHRVTNVGIHIQN